VIVVAGATGALGRRVATRLLDRGVPVRVLARDPVRLGPLADRAQIHRGDALDPSTLRGVCEGAAALFSSVGASVQPGLGGGRAGYLAVDVPANLNLLAQAQRADVPRVVYVAQLLLPAARATAYVQAHEAVVDRLRTSRFDWCALRPTGFHSAFVSMLDLAARGMVPVFGPGTARTNPIADDDLAALAVEQLLAATPIAQRELDCGGPDVLSRREIAQLACTTAGRGRVLHLPEALAAGMVVLARPVSPRMSDLLRFVLAVGSSDAIAPVRGATPLAATFAAAMAARRR
jgi:uncharacterized protein YbjT (DUF2867 family)